MEFGVEYRDSKGKPILDGMKNSSDPFTEEIKIDTKITNEDARGHQH